MGAKIPKIWDTLIDMETWHRAYLASSQWARPVPHPHALIGNLGVPLCCDRSGGPDHFHSGSPLPEKTTIKLTSTTQERGRGRRQ